MSPWPLTTSIVALLIAGAAILWRSNRDNDDDDWGPPPAPFVQVAPMGFHNPRPQA